MDDFHFEMTPTGMGSASNILLPAVALLILLILRSLTRTIDSPAALLIPVVYFLLLYLMTLPRRKEAVKVTINDHELYVVTRGSRKEKALSVHEIYTAKMRKNSTLVLEDESGKDIFTINKNFTNYDRFLLYLQRSGVEMPEKQ